MAKQLNVNLAFTADTSAAQAQLKQLERQLDALINKPNTGSNQFFSKQISEASLAASKLKSNLQDAMNVNTGKLDLSKFMASMRSGNMSLEQYRVQLSALGIEGEKAFAELSTAIMNAEAPLFRLNGAMGQLWVTMKNTMRWQLTSSVLHGFMGAIQHAYGYAKDLNKSLNNIRIVTGQSTEEMARFAKQANETARALSTTTLDYTDAALIYYQQGIRDQEEIAGRVETTIKLANVSRQSAEEVSQEMTAIWNNFYDGSKSLEYYADAITALGATTASSSEEIATGLQKFAAVANTVGLSYEYATAALATITAQTRQSADTVGTGLRTLFARLESVKLGETLDDGVELNKYSKALNDVGVSILNANGGMKDMDTILDELGAKWQTLTREQQMALAQTVGGVRQYTNLIALMDNWGKMQENVLTARNSEGTLQQQADIYAESWEAARDRVKAAAEKIYSALLNDKAFISLTNGFEKILSFIGRLTDGLGGFKGVLLAISTLITTVFNKQLANGIASVGMAIRSMTPAGKKDIEQFKENAIRESMKGTDDGTMLGATQNRLLEERGTIQLQYIKQAKHLTEEQRNQVTLLLDQNKVLKENVELAAKERQDAQKNVKKTENTAIATGTDRTTLTIRGGQAAHATHGLDIQATLQNTMNKIQTKADGSAEQKQLIDSIKGSINSLVKEYDQLGLSMDKVLGKEMNSKFDLLKIALEKGDPKEIEQAWKNFSNSIDTANQKYEEYKAKIKETNPELYAFITAKEQEAEATDNQTLETTKFTSSLDLIREKMQQTKMETMTLSQAITQAAGVLSSAAMAVNMMSSMIDTLNDENADAKTKITSVLMTLGMLIPLLMRIGKSLVDLKKGVTVLGVTIKLSFGEILLIIGAVALVIFGLVKAFQALHDASPEGKLEQASKAAKDLAKAADEAKQALEDLKSAFNGYDTAVDALRRVERGTKAWEEAIKKVNEEVLSLIDNYPELMKYAKFDTSQGYRRIVNQSELLQLAEQKANNARLASIAAKNTVTNAQLNVTKENLRTKVSNTFDYYNNEARSTSDQVDTTKLSNFIVQNAQELYANRDALSETIERLTQSQGYEATETNLLTQAIQNNKTAIFRYAQETDDAADAISTTKDLLIDQILDSSAGEQKREAASDAYDKYYNDIYEQAYAQATAMSRTADKDDTRVVELMKRYEEATGTRLNLSSNAVQYGGVNREFEYIENGEKKTITAQMLAAEIAVAEAAEEMKKAADKAEDIVPTDNNGRPRKDVSTFGIKEQQAELRKIIGDGLKIGDIVKDEDITKLRAAGVDVSDFFTQLADGTWQLNQNAKLFNDTIKHITTDRLMNVVQNFRAGEEQKNNILQAGDWTSNYGWESEAAEQQQRGRDIADYLSGFSGLELPAEISSVLEALSSNKDYELTAEELAQLENGLKLVGDAAAQAEYELFTNATTLEELRAITTALGEYSETNYSTALIGIASQYDNCKTELEKYNEALNQGTQEEIQKTKATLEAAIAIGEAAKTYGLNADELEIQAEQIRATIGEEKISVQQAARLAIANQRLNKGVKTLNENWDNWGKALNASDKNTKDWAEAAAKTRSAVADLTNEVDENNITSKFLIDNLDKIDKASKGDVKAINALSVALAKSKIDALTTTDVLGDAVEYYNSLGELQVLDTSQFENWKTTLSSGIESLSKQLDTLQEGDPIGDILGKDWVDSLNQMAIATGMSVEEMNSLLSQLGVDTEVTTIPVTQKVKVPEYRTEQTNQEYDEHGNLIAYNSKTWQVGTEEMDGVIDVAQISAGDNAGAAPKINYRPPSSRGAGGISSSSKGGGGGGGSQKKTKKLDDELDRYHYIRETIEDLERVYDDAGKAKDRLFGGDRVKAINKEIEATEDLIDAQDRYLNEISNYLNKTDIPNLQSTVKGYAGISVVLDEVGRIQNYDQIMRAAVTKFNADLSEDADEKYEEFKKKIEQYEETINLYEAELSKREDLVRQKQDHVFERLNYVVELKVKVNEADLKRIETELKILGDSVYRAAERLDLLWNEAGHTADEFGNISEAFNIAKYELDQLNDDFANGRISQDQFNQGLDDCRDKAYDALERLLDLDDTMRTYYSTTLSDATSELEFWNKQLEHSVTVLEHYQKVAELTGHGKDYDMLGVIFAGQESVRKDQLDTLTNEYEMIHKQRLAIDQEMRDAQANYAATMGTDQEDYWKGQVEYLRDKWDSIVEADNEAYEKRLEALENYLEAAEATYQNKMNQLYKQMEDDATNGIGFDFLNDSIDRLNTYNDEYLTKTNQIYETTKLLRQVNIDMDKVQSQAAKAKLKDYGDMVEELKEQNQLSKFELDIAKAKYEVVKAQIALEEAQNAKSVVRLSRDSEGNYGYVYSADPDKVNQAEQDLADKNNDLYNLLLNGENDYGQKLIKLREDYLAKFTELQTRAREDEEYATTQYQQDLEQLNREFEQLQLSYYNSYCLARSEINAVAVTDYTEAWVTAYDSILDNTSYWDEQQATYAETAKTNLDELNTKIDESVGKETSMASAVEQVVTQSAALKDTINDEVIPALEAQLTAINNQTKAYANQRLEIAKLEKELKNYIDLIDKQNEKESEKAEEELKKGKEEEEKRAQEQQEKKDAPPADQEASKATEQVAAPTVNETVKKHVAAAIWNGNYGWGVNPQRRERLIEVFGTDNGIQNIVNQGVGYVSGYSPVGYSYTEMRKKMVGYDTGGYTGTWGDRSGRLAMLHQKELVLNEDDTSNMLQAIELIRQVVAAIDLNAVSAAAGLGYINSPALGAGAQELEQNVHIDANFPGVTDHNEIEQALTSLVNRAAQFANRK